MSTSGGTEPYTLQVAEQVFAYVQPDGGWCLSNAGFVTGDKILLVDTAATLRRTLLLKDAVWARTGRCPDLVVNTHFHGDHSFGNCVFAGEAAVIASQGTRRDIAMAGLHLTSLWPDVDWGELSICPPSVCFEDRLTIDVGGLQVELLRVGPAHTLDDTIVWLPESRVLFAGDLVMSGVTPFCMMGSIEGCLTVTTLLRDLDPLVIVPGHGAVGGQELLTESENYLRMIQRLAADGISAGLRPLEAAREADLGPFADFLDAERLVPNLHRAYLEARGGIPGEAMDIEKVFKEMAIFRRPVCRA